MPDVEFRKTPRGLAAGAMLALALPAAAQLEPTKPAPRPVWEGAIGVLAGNGPEYMGSDRDNTRLQPGLFVRYGRVSLATRSGFATRREGDLSGGVAVEVGGSRSVRGGLALRWDSGRGEAASPLLAGMGDVQSTLRARLSVRWNIDAHWRAGAAWNADVLGRGGGALGELSLRHDRPLSPRTQGSIGLALTHGNARYMQTNFGITPEQSARSSYAVYRPGAGLRDLGLSLGLRHDFSEDWFAFGGLRFGRLVGPAADSPLVRQATSRSWSAGLARRF